jgi:vacuolar-type H+-ATPase subunit I/STV1
MEWILFLSQLPTNPSSLRVTVWRKMRLNGALGLQNGVWMLPNTSEQIQFLQDLSKIIQNQGASCQIFTVSPLDQRVEEDILERFQSDRSEEYDEFIERSEGFLAEIDKETKKQKFTFAELEENEQDLQRLTNWLEKIQKRDFIGGEKANLASNFIEQCRTVFEDFSTNVYNSTSDEEVRDADTGNN